MTGRMELVGGPLDGAMVVPQRGRYAWIAAKLNVLPPALARITPGARAPAPRVREARGATNVPTSGRALYELLDGVYVYAGHRKTYCNTCGAYHGKVEGGSERPPCALGGTEP